MTTVEKIKKFIGSNIKRLCHNNNDDKFHLSKYI